MNTPAKRHSGLAWMLVMAGAIATGACDRNTAPPQQPTTHVIELTRADPAPATPDPSALETSTTRGSLPALPYGAAAPMAPGTDGVRPPVAEAGRMAGLDQAPLPLNTPEAIVNRTPTGAGAAGTTPSVALSATEMAFLTQATEASLFDLRIGQLGVERATNSAVKSYAAMLVSDQASLSNGLQQLARRLAVPLPSSLSEPKQQVLDNLARTGTQDFDRQFVNAVGARDHASTVELFERTGRETRNPQVRTYVLNTLPILRAQLTAAERLPIKG